MKKNERYHNFIIGMLLVVFIITGAGYGLGEECQVFSSSYMEKNSEISVPSLTISNGLHTFQISERNSVVLRYSGLQSNRSEESLRGDFVFLCVLAALSVFFRLIQELFTQFRRLYVHDRFYAITFMQDMDGRKRVS